MSTSPTSSVASGVGVVSKVPSRLRSATMIAPVSLRMSRSLIDLPPCPHSRVTSISSKRRSLPVELVTTSTKAFLRGRLLRVLAEVEDDEGRPRVPELVRDAPADPTESADDVVVAQCLDRP